MAVASILVALVSCSTTPGDAANRSDHSRQAAELYRQGAEQGDAVAALKLGLLIEDDASLITEFGEPGRWFVRSCEIVDDAGCHNAGVGYEYGNNGLTKSYEQARDYYQKAARRGYMKSQYNPGSLYSNLYFQDDVTGLTWLLAAQDNARACVTKPLCKWILDDAPGHVAKLKGRMTPEDIATADRESMKVSKSRA